MKTIVLLWLVLTLNLACSRFQDEVQVDVSCTQPMTITIFPQSSWEKKVYLSYRDPATAALPSICMYSLDNNFRAIAISLLDLNCGSKMVLEGKKKVKVSNKLWVTKNTYLETYTEVAEINCFYPEEYLVILTARNMEIKAMPRKDFYADLCSNVYACPSKCSSHNLQTGKIVYWQNNYNGIRLTFKIKNDVPTGHNKSDKQQVAAIESLHLKCLSVNGKKYQYDGILNGCVSADLLSNSLEISLDYNAHTSIVCITILPFYKTSQMKNCNTFTIHAVVKNCSADTREECGWMGGFRCSSTHSSSQENVEIGPIYFLPQYIRKGITTYNTNFQNKARTIVSLDDSWTQTKKIYYTTKQTDLLIKRNTTEKPSTAEKLVNVAPTSLDKLVRLVNKNYTTESHVAATEKTTTHSVIVKQGLLKKLKNKNKVTFVTSIHLQPNREDEKENDEDVDLDVMIRNFPVDNLGDNTEKALSSVSEKGDSEDKNEMFMWILTCSLSVLVLLSVVTAIILCICRRPTKRFT